MILADDFVERENLGWRIEPGVPDPSNPLIEPKYPWDSAATFVSGTILRDPADGLWKVWAASYEHVPGPGLFEAARARLTYASSEDGVHWERPKLPGKPCLGEKETNVIFDLAPDGHSHYTSVFLNEPGHGESRFEMLIMRSRGNLPNGMYRYRSKDGIAWERVSDLLAIETSDSIFIYKDLDAPYVALHKRELPAFPGAHVIYDIGAGGLRVLCRRTSDDGDTWSDPPELILTPDWQDTHDTQFMDIQPLQHGGGYIATVTVYHALSGTIDLQFAGSRDGRRWWRPSRRACLPNAPLGDYGGGMIWPMRQPVEIAGRLYVYYCASQGLHGDIYAGRSNAYLDYGALCRASWEKGRLWAAAPAPGGPVEASLCTPPLSDAQGKELFINAVTTGDGEVVAELLSPAPDGSPGKAIQGFSRQDATAFQGNDKLHVFQWKGGSRVPCNDAMLRLHLRRAYLYGYELR